MKKRALENARNGYGVKRNQVNQKNNLIKTINAHYSNNDVKPSHL